MDETRVHVLNEDGRESSQMSQMWVFCSAEKKIALYQYSPSRSGRVAKEMLQGFSGSTQTDGYSGYNCLDSGDPCGLLGSRKTQVGGMLCGRQAGTGKPIRGSVSSDRGDVLPGAGLERPIGQRPALLCGRKNSGRWLDSYWELLDSFEAAEGTALSKAKTYVAQPRAGAERRASGRSPGTDQ